MASNQDNSANEGKRQNTSNRGFAAMDPEQQRAIASKGGQAAHEQGRAHEFNSEEAREAGRKGGEAVSRNREHMAEIGRKGGQARGNNNRRESDQRESDQ
jgi:uncharacterized protein